MKDYELKHDFDQEVLERSRTVPVVVDFWAAWCGPCRLLSPILEKLAEEADGAWELVTIDTEAHPDLAAEFRISGIPAVKLFVDGRPAGEFMGALPESRVRDWLRENLPHPSAGDLESAREAFAAGDLAEARHHLQRALAQDPEDQEARVTLARILFLDDAFSAADLAAEIPESDPAHAVAGNIALLADLLRGLQSGALEGDSQEARLYRSAAEQLSEKDYAGALDRWLTLLGRNRTYADDGARKAYVALLSVLGEGHPLTRKYRAKLASALY